MPFEEIVTEQDTLPLAEVLSSLSYALDLTSGQPMGHAQGSCLIGMRIASLLGLDDDLKTSLYHALLIKDSGCSSNAARMYEIFGSDERVAKRDSKVVDWTNLFEAARYAAAHALPDSPLLARARRMVTIAAHQTETSADLMESRCNRGAEIALALGLGEDAAECIRTLDEHWDGNGAPYRVSRESIPLLGRIACLAQTLEVFARTFGVDAAYAVAHKRSRKWFDPSLVKVAEQFQNDEAFWYSVIHDSRHALLRLDTRATIEMATQDRIDSICDAFAQIVDAKSHFTGEHSERVCGYSLAIAHAFGFGEERLRTLRRAALLHDIGKLAVPNSILDKAGKPTDDEWRTIRLHPYYTREILKHIRGFSRITEVAAAHHERLDGTGYFQGLDADQLDLDMRIVAVADVYDALSAKRPYRGAMPLDRVLAILDAESGTGLDADCIDAIRQFGGDLPLPQTEAVTKPFLMAA